MADLPPVPACIAQWNQPANKARKAIARLHPKAANVTAGKSLSVTWGNGGQTQTNTGTCVIIFLGQKTIFAMGHLGANDWTWNEGGPWAPAGLAKRVVTPDGKVK